MLNRTPHSDENASSDDQKAKKTSNSGNKDFDRKYLRKLEPKAPKRPRTASRKTGSDSDKPYERKTEGKSEYGDKPFEKKPYERKPYEGKSEERGGYKKREGGYGDKPFEKKPYERKPYEGKSDDRGGYKKREGGYGDKPFEKKPYERKPYEGKSDERGGYKKRESGYGDKPFEKKPYERKPYEGKSDERGGYQKREGGYGDKPFEKKPYERKTDDRGPYQKRTGSGYSDKPYSSEGKPYEKKPFERRTDDKGGYKKSYDKRPFERDNRDQGADQGGYKKRSEGGFDDKPFYKKDGDSFDKKPSRWNDGLDKGDRFKKEDKPFTRSYPRDNAGAKPSNRGVKNTEWGNQQDENQDEFSTKSKFSKSGRVEPEPIIQDEIRLNRYISNAGVCSRREADDLISSGVITVNGKIITELGYKIKAGDVVNYGGATLKNEAKRYLLLNKPKDYITTVDDPEKRQTVMELIKGACKERLYPVGRLDRATTGLLLFTNDGDMAKRLTHPSHSIKKIYHVTLDKSLKPIDYKQIVEGLTLEDGPIDVDDIAFVGDGKDKAEVGIELHSGRNRVVRRLFEHLGYKVQKLDRVVFAGLTKRDLPRGRWRFLTQEEVNFLKMSVK